MRISELIKKLEGLKNDNGDLNVCVSEPHEYWGSIESSLDDNNVVVNELAQPNGPKSHKFEKAVILKCY